MPPYNFQSLFYDNVRQEIVNFGGEVSYLSSNPPDLSVWRMKVDGKGGGTWTQDDTNENSPYSEQIHRPFGGASAANNHTAFYIGGYSSSHSSVLSPNVTSFVPTPGIVDFDFKSSSWSNNTDTLALSTSGTLMWGAMEPVPFGPNGLLAVFGGDTSNSNSYVPGQDKNAMNVIHLFDPVTKIWYKQATTGPTPSSRSWFCTAGVGDRRPVSGSNSTGTHEMYVPLLKPSFTREKLVQDSSVDRRRSLRPCNCKSIIK